MIIFLIGFFYRPITSESRSVRLNKTDGGYGLKLKFDEVVGVSSCAHTLKNLTQYYGFLISALEFILQKRSPMSKSKRSLIAFELSPASNRWESWKGSSLKINMFQIIPGGPADLNGGITIDDYIESVNGFDVSHFTRPNGISDFLEASHDYAILGVYDVSICIYI